MQNFGFKRVIVGKRKGRWIPCTATLAISESLKTKKKASRKKDSM
jgi:hypothetical protein